MINQRIGRVKIRRGKFVETRNIVYDSGEIFYLIDKEHLFVGDGVTLGGVCASNRSYVVNGKGVPLMAAYGDIVYNRQEDITYIVGHDIDNFSLRLFEISNPGYYRKLQYQIKDLYTKLSTITGCLEGTTAPKPIPPVPVYRSWTGSYDDSWFTISNWYNDGLSATNLPTSASNVVIDSDRIVVVDLDNPSWVQPATISLLTSQNTNATIKFVSFTSKNVSCKITNLGTIILSGNATYNP